MPVIKAHDIKVLMDTDGDVTTMIPWFLMMGGFNKLTTSQGGAAARAEFERLLP